MVLTASNASRVSALVVKEPPTPNCPSPPAEMIWYVCAFWKTTLMLPPATIGAVRVDVYGAGDPEGRVPPASAKFRASGPLRLSSSSEPGLAKKFTSLGSYPAPPEE